MFTGHENVSKSVQLLEPAAEARGVVVEAVEGEGHPKRAADDAMALDQADVPAVVAVVAVVAHHEIVSGGYRGDGKGAHGREPGRHEHDLVRPSCQELFDDECAALVRVGGG